jgi:hypothetical protein
MAAEALAITEVGRTALAKHRTELVGKKGRHGPGILSYRGP